MSQLGQILSIQIFGNQVEVYATTLLVIILIYLFFRFLFGFFAKQLEKYARKTKTEIDDAVVLMVEKNRWTIFLAIALLYIILSLNLSSRYQKIFWGFFNITAVFLAIRIIQHWIQYVTKKFIKKGPNSAEQFSVKLLGRAVHILAWVFGGLFLISSFGYNISSLIAGLGIGGLAVALAVQNILGDLISAISIYLDKPFRVGDYIVIGDQSGTVRSIGLKTTRITSLHGEEIVISNKKLTESDINNFGRMKKRRVTIPIGVTYKTSLQKMRKIPVHLKKIIDLVDDATFEHAFFKSFGPYSKDFELVFYVESQDYLAYTSRLEEVNLKIEEYFKKAKVEFAYPTRTLYMKR